MLVDPSIYNIHMGRGYDPRDQSNMTPRPIACCGPMRSPLTSRACYGMPCISNRHFTSYGGDILFVWTTIHLYDIINDPCLKYFPDCFMWKLIGCWPSNIKQIESVNVLSCAACVEYTYFCVSGNNDSVRTFRSSGRIYYFCARFSPDVGFQN